MTSNPTEATPETGATYWPHVYGVPETLPDPIDQSVDRLLGTPSSGGVMTNVSELSEEAIQYANTITDEREWADRLSVVRDPEGVEPPLILPGSTMTYFETLMLEMGYGRVAGAVDQIRKTYEANDVANADENKILELAIEQGNKHTRAASALDKIPLENDIEIIRKLFSDSELFIETNFDGLSPEQIEALIPSRNVECAILMLAGRVYRIGEIAYKYTATTDGTDGDEKTVFSSTGIRMDFNSTDPTQTVIAPVADRLARYAQKKVVSGGAKTDSRYQFLPTDQQPRAELNEVAVSPRPIQAKELVDGILEGLTDQVRRQAAEDELSPLVTHLAHSYNLLIEFTNLWTPQVVDKATEVGHSQISRFLDATEAYPSIMERIMAETKIALETSPNELRAYGALAVEAWMRRMNYPAGSRGRGIDEMPLHAGILSAEREEQEQNRAEKTGNLNEQIDRILKRYEFSNKQLKRIDEGYGLTSRLEGLQESGDPVFMQDEARLLTWLALNKELHSTLPDDIKELRQLSWDIQTLIRYEQPRVLGAIGGLLELHEAGSLDDHGFKVFKDLAEVLVARSSEDVENDSDIKNIFSQQENIYAFPPGKSIANSNEKRLFEDAAGRLSMGEYVEWGRIDKLAQLATDLKQEGYQIDSCRLLASEWHPLPHYVLIAKKDQRTAVVVESPIYGNATYVMKEPGGVKNVADTWEIIVQMSKNEARGEGAKALVHVPSMPEGHHTGRIKREMVT